MSATIAASEARAVPPAVSSVQEIPLESIRESSSNPRRAFDDGQLRELADFVPGNKIRVMFRTRLCAPRVGDEDGFPIGGTESVLASLAKTLVKPFGMNEKDRTAESSGRLPFTDAMSIHNNATSTSP